MCSFMLQVYPWQSVRSWSVADGKDRRETLNATDRPSYRRRCRRQRPQERYLRPEQRRRAGRGRARRCRAARPCGRGGEGGAARVGGGQSAAPRARDVRLQADRRGASRRTRRTRSEEHTSELQSLMRISYAVFCLKKKKTKTNTD